MNFYNSFSSIFHCNRTASFFKTAFYETLNPSQRPTLVTSIFSKKVLNAQYSSRSFDRKVGLDLPGLMKIQKKFERLHCESNDNISRRLLNRGIERGIEVLSGVTSRNLPKALRDNDDLATRWTY